MRDILLNTENDLQIMGGDLQIAESSNQHVSLLAATTAGEWKRSPSAGMGLSRFLLTESSDITKMLHIIDVQLQADGVKSKTARVINGQLQIDAKY